MAHLCVHDCHIIELTCQKKNEYTVFVIIPDIFENALSKLKELEDSNYSSSSISQSEEESTKKRKTKKSSKYREYLDQYDDSEEEEYLPPVPKPVPVFSEKKNMRNTKQITRKSFDRNTESNKETEKPPTSQKTEIQYDSFDILENTIVPDEPLVTFNELNTCCRKTLGRYVIFYLENISINNSRIVLTLYLQLILQHFNKK